MLLFLVQGGLGWGRGMGVQGRHDQPHRTPATPVRMGWRAAGVDWGWGGWQRAAACPSSAGCEALPIFPSCALQPATLLRHATLLPRSASRIGESDGNINRKRIKALRLELQKKGWKSVGY